MKKIVIVAGDKSGDLYGGFLCKKLKEKFSSFEIFSFGGENLAQYSRQMINLTSYAVSGLFEVLSSLGEFLRIFREITKKIKEIEPDLIILIDFPDFNLKLAKTLNKKYPLFYYISPQVWAWRKKRVELIKKYADKMVVIFKFEEDFYRKEGVDVLYFGHPLLEIIEKKNTETKKIISCLPGSRKNEIKRHLPLICAAKRIIEKELKDYSFRIIKPQNIEGTFYEKLGAKIEVVNHSYQTLWESEFIIASSGTATVEIAVLEIPFLIIYKVNPFTWQILKKMVKTEFIGMINILAKEMIVPEFMQREATPRNIAQETLKIMSDKEKYEQLKGNLKKIKEKLLPRGATEKFSDFIGDYLNLS